MEKMQLDILFASEAFIREENETVALLYGEISDMFLSDAHSSEIGRMLTDISHAHNLMPVDLRLSPPTAFEAGDLFYITTVSMTVNGTYDDLKSLLDTVEEIEYLRVSRLSFSKSQPLDTVSRIALTFEVTVIKEREKSEVIF
jgi:hypothetical protein